MESRIEFYTIPRKRWFGKTRLEHWWRAFGKNGENIGGSREGYWNKADCEHNADILMLALIEDHNARQEKLDEEFLVPARCINISKKECTLTHICQECPEKLK